MPITNAPRSYQRIKTRRALQQVLDATNVEPIEPPEVIEKTLMQVLVAGDAAETPITVTGIKESDELVSVIFFDTGVPADVTDEVTITGEDTIELSSTNTSGGHLLITFFSVEQPEEEE